jgi:hypothetical protein
MLYQHTSPPQCVLRGMSLPCRLRFDVRMMRVNHDRNFKAFCDSLAAGTHTVIVDNTNIQYWHYQRYEEEAVDQGYEVEEVNSILGH